MRHPRFIQIDPRYNAAAAVGFIPTFLDLDDPRPAKEQIAERYVSGWFPFEGHNLNIEDGMILTFEDDPPMWPIAFAVMHDDLVFVYPHGWTMLFHKDGKWEIARLD